MKKIYLYSISPNISSLISTNRRFPKNGNEQHLLNSPGPSSQQWSFFLERPLERNWGKYIVHFVETWNEEIRATKIIIHRVGNSEYVEPWPLWY